jgi:hypothetical protein
MPTNRFLVASLLAFAGVIASTSAPDADIVRHCTATIFAKVVSGVNANGQAFVMGASSYTPAVSLNGRGGCPSTVYANDCRRRARDAIISCAVGIWAERWNRRVPPDKCESADNTRPPHAGVTAWGAPGTPSSVRTTLINDVKRSLEHAACCIRQPTARQLNFKVELRVTGDTRCSHARDLIGTHYEADCQQLRNQGLCG